ncbi:MAG: flavoprotein, partial [Pseudonocardiaceae bacterium]
LSRLGAIIVPPVPAFYNRPATIDDIVTHIAARVLDQFGLDLPGASRWIGPPPRRLPADAVSSAPAC